MKKIVFALQVTGLIALLPICMVLEMNHGITTENNTKKQVLKNEQTSPAEMGSSVAKYPVASIAFGLLAFKGKQKCSNAACNCKNCGCGSNCTCKDF